MAAEAAAGNAGGAIRRAQAHEALVREELGRPRIRRWRPWWRGSGTAYHLAARISESSQPVPARAAPGAPPPIPSTPREAGAHPEPLQREARAIATSSSRRPRPLGTATPACCARATGATTDRSPSKCSTPRSPPGSTSSASSAIRLTGKLLHPHILPLLDSGEVAGRPWYAVPRPKGETLRSRLSREGRIRVEEAVRLTLELAEALGQAHAEGIVHRDVSPENVLLGDSPQAAGTTGGCHALLTNLGLARALDVAAGAELTATGTLVGTPGYMSPEQAEGARTVDARSDVYSLAAVLFEMLTGEALFSGPTPQAIMAKRAAEPTPSGVRFAELPDGLVLALRTALAAKPSDRYPSAAAFASAISATAAAELRTIAPAGGRAGWLSSQDGASNRDPRRRIDPTKIAQGLDHFVQAVSHCAR